MFAASSQGILRKRKLAPGQVPRNEMAGAIGDGRVRRAAWCWALIALCTGCLGPIPSMWPPAVDAPAVPVWIVDHGWHTGLVLRRSSLPPGLLPEADDFPAARYLEFGWGDADFYRARDPGVALAVRAAVLSRASVIHVVGLPLTPEQTFASQDLVEIRLSRLGFDALARFVHDSVDRDGQRAAPRREAGLYGDSAFYLSRERYHLLNTCNTWIADALRAAGLPITPAYAMTAGNLMWQVRRR